MGVAEEEMDPGALDEDVYVVDAQTAVASNAQALLAGFEGVAEVGLVPPGGAEERRCGWLRLTTVFLQLAVSRRLRGGLRDFDSSADKG